MNPEFKIVHFEASICRESDQHPWQTFIQISDDNELISSVTFDFIDVDETRNAMSAYFLTHTPEVITSIVNQCCVRNEISDAVYRAWKLNTK